MIIIRSNNHGFSFIDESTGDYIMRVTSDDCWANPDHKVEPGDYPMLIGPTWLDTNAVIDF